MDLRTSEDDKVISPSVNISWLNQDIFYKHSFRMSCSHCENLFVSCKELWPKESSGNDVLSLGLEDVLPLKVGSALEEGVNVTGKV